MFGIPWIAVGFLEVLVNFWFEVKCPLDFSDFPLIAMGYDFQAVYCGGDIVVGQGTLFWGCFV